MAAELRVPGVCQQLELIALFEQSNLPHLLEQPSSNPLIHRR